MTVETIYEMLIAVLPAVTSVIGCIVAIVKAVKTVKKVKEDSTAEVIVLEGENQKLREQVKQLQIIANKNASTIVSIENQLDRIIDHIDKGE